MVVEREAFDILPSEGNHPLESSLLEALSAQQQVSVYCHEGFWQCMDTYREKQLLDAMWQRNEAPWRIWA